MKRRFTGFLFAFILVSVVVAQDVTYRYEFSSVDLLETPNVNSYAEEIYPLYNRSYDTLYLVRSHHNDNIGRNKINQDIWYSYKENGSWSAVKNFKEMNNAENNSIVGIGNITEKLYLLNSYTSTSVRDRAVVQTKFDNGSWTKPKTLDLEVNTGNNLYSFFINHLEDVILITMFHGMSEGQEDLFVSLKGENGHWRDPIYMGHQVNSAGYETSPFLTDDKKTMFFTSDGFGGYGEGDIYMSQRLDDSWTSWTEPINLGQEVNSPKFDGYFSLYENGEFLYASNKDTKFSDIFKGNWERFEVKKEETVVQVTEVIDCEEDKVLPENFEIYFSVNSAKLDTKKYQDSMDGIVTYLEANPDVAVVFEGQTDAIGGERFNLLLSLDRANNVKDHIVKLSGGNFTDRVIVIPSGESKSSGDRDKSRKVVASYVLMKYL